MVEISYLDFLEYLEHSQMNSLPFLLLLLDLRHLRHVLVWIVHLRYREPYVQYLRLKEFAERDPELSAHGAVYHEINGRVEECEYVEDISKRLVAGVVEVIAYDKAEEH